MATFLAGRDLSEAIKTILAEPGVRCAVAFWGSGAEKLVTGPGAQVVCNLRTGGTNPFALRKVQAALKHRDDLHAKVYIGQSSAVVASANASVNGLGLEGTEQAGWIEAGVIVDDNAPLAAWFDELWNRSFDIKKADWDAAEAAWKARQKPTVRFADFDTSADVLPLVNWVGDRQWVTCEDSIRAQFGGSSPELVRQVEAGLELEHPDDATTLRHRWVLSWYPDRANLPKQRQAPWWVRLSGTVVNGGFHFVGEEETRRDVIMAVETMPSVPFNPAEKRFVSALRAVLRQPAYATLIEGEYEAPWFTPRAALMRQLWRDVKATYLAMPD